jgi:hypothetical protein
VARSAVELPPHGVRGLLAWLRSFALHLFAGGEGLIAFGGKDRERHERAAKRRKQEG